jgi:hypothetical protein
MGTSIVAHVSTCVLLLGLVYGVDNKPDDAVSKMFSPERAAKGPAQHFLNKIGEKMSPKKEPDLICRSP